MSTLVFAIETSCDETSVAILNDKRKILSHITVNQEDHDKFGGVVPEIASRAHLQILQTIIPQAFKEAKRTINDIDIFCATCGPGLIGGLLVGSMVAKSMAIGTNKPFYPINHLEGHILSPMIDAAGTEHESVLSLCANFSSLVLISIDLNGFIKVGIGFIVADRVILCPLLIPPSIPPQLLLNL